MKPLKIFIVDDDPDLAEGVAMILEIEGHEVEFASSGEEALKRLREDDFDLTFMDVRMPGMNGVECFLEICKFKPEAKVIMMTAFSVHNLLEQALEKGALGVLHKPFSGDAMLKALAAAKPAGAILLADDDPEFVEGVEAVLSDAGYKVIVAKTGHEAVEKALNQNFDVLLLDMRMPQLDGFDVYRELREQGIKTPTIVVTGYDIEEADKISQLRGMCVKNCLVKPVGADDLLQAIERVA